MLAHFHDLVLLEQGCLMLQRVLRFELDWLVSLVKLDTDFVKPEVVVRYWQLELVEHHRFDFDFRIVEINTKDQN